jgi:D-alanyl-D-alanine carboxypeptidase
VPKGFPEKGDVTVEHLLQHTGGGWPNDRADPMFKRYALDQTRLIRWALPEYDLAHQPGEHFAYSNFGYLLLGRVIKKKSGQKYEDYVQQAVLKPAGVRDMHIAGDTLDQRRPNEVVYYDDAPRSPYTCRVARMDAHGGWIACPRDLLRLMVRVDGFAAPLDILRPQTIAVMTTPSAANSHYAKGWNVNAAHNWWHTGSLPGTASMLVRAQNGFCWAIVMNRRGSGGAFARDLDQLGWKIRSAVKAWPEPEDHK